MPPGDGMGAPLRAYFGRLPLTDRVTHYLDLWSALLSGAFSGLTLSLSTIVARRIGVTSTQIAIMAAMPFVGQLLNLYLGHLASRGRKMPFVFWPGFLSRTLLVGMVFVRTPVPYFLLMSVYGLVNILTAPAYAAIMRSNYSERNRGLLMGNSRVVVMVSSALFSYLSGWALDLLPGGYRWIFPLGALAGASAWIVFGRIRVRRDERDATAHFPFMEALGSLRSDRRYLVFLGLVFLCTGPNKLSIPLEPIWFVDVLGIDYRQAGLVLGTASSLSSLLGYVVWGRLSRDRSPLPLLVLSLVLVTLRYPVLAVSGGAGGVVIASMLSGFGNAGFELLVLFCVMRFSRGGRLGLNMGLHSAFIGIRGLVGPFIGSSLYAGAGLPIQTVFWIITGTTALGLGLLTAFTVRQERAGAMAVDANR